MDYYPIRYSLKFDDGSAEEFSLRLDPNSLVLLDPPPDPVPDWARLDCHRCECCTLPTTTPLCPTAAHLAGVIGKFAHALRQEEAEVRVEMPERVVVMRSPVRLALSSLLGAYMAASGCPVLAALRPMVRFHLPFASEMETTWRAASMYLVAQYLRQRAGLKPEWDLGPLVEAYRRTQQVNFGMSRRMRQAENQDAIDTLVLLDLFAQGVPADIDGGLEELRDLFEPWLQA